MREAAEKKKELEKQHGESVNELRTAQAQLGLLASNKNTEVERAQHSQNIESLQVVDRILPFFISITASIVHPFLLLLFLLVVEKQFSLTLFCSPFMGVIGLLCIYTRQSRIRELERKMELQNVRHDELLLELAALRRNQHHHHANNSSGSSHHGSSQSLGAAFDLDSRGSSPGIILTLFALFVCLFFSNSFDFFKLFFAK